ncbi:hypothetical protein COT75_04980 [Candidatus Beckwithbacteria bacterium CG10_big_fil_rev_8_21_14_0_10_34_10]|uniref:Methyltransferase domain-containing protein n=1 Tax=Candidatus Beckwithbacteria bacterium CG10_big_fil_rev_8_21_14_0_10_34_10 TaxID=1974495 RepID=A0A2H0W805_9BACT|nr:MAG: hypothetical protein COT75_04980 [Candidatus Beckwithbacteria bacterium CG10_big_fil_rev_8_21_14_0_10_34_10]
MTIKNILKFIVCPYCHKKLLLRSQQLNCSSCKNIFPIIKGVPILLKKNKLNKQEIKQQEKFDYYYRQYPLTYNLEYWQQSMLKRIFNHSFKRNIKTYLDIGCGAICYTTIEAVKRNNWLSFGVDISLEAVIKAKLLARKKGLDDKTAFLVCSAEHLPFKNNIFDYISAVSVLEHLANDKKLVNDAVRVLNKKSYLYICVPNAYKNIWPFLWPFYWLGDFRMGHQRHYSLKNLNKIMEKRGCKLIKYFYNGHLIKLVQLLLEKLHLLKGKQWWQWEKKDINLNPKGLQLNAIYQKKQVL